MKNLKQAAVLGVMVLMTVAFLKLLPVFAVNKTAFADEKINELM